MGADFALVPIPFDAPDLGIAAAMPYQGGALRQRCLSRVGRCCRNAVILRGTSGAMLRGSFTPERRHRCACRLLIWASQQRCPTRVRRKRQRCLSRVGRCCRNAQISCGTSAAKFRTGEQSPWKIPCTDHSARIASFCVPCALCGCSISALGFDAKTRRCEEFQPRMNTDGHGFLLPQENAWNAKSEPLIDADTR